MKRTFEIQSATAIPHREGAYMFFTVEGDAGAVSLSIATNWNPSFLSENFTFPPSGEDLSIWTGKQKNFTSGLAADTLLNLLLDEGSEVLWKKLEELYFLLQTGNLEKLDQDLLYLAKPWLFSPELDM